MYASLIQVVYNDSVILIQIAAAGVLDGEPASARSPLMACLRDQPQCHDWSSALHFKLDRQLKKNLKDF